MYKKIITGLLLFSVCALLLAGCAGQGASSAEAKGKKADSSATSTEKQSSAGDKKGDATLYIGEQDHLKKVSVQNASTAEELIAALAKETGWNLTLAKPVTDGADSDTKTVAFATASAIYSAPPDPQKESYHVYDSEEYVLTVLNSVSETLCKNLDLKGVYFTAPDGGVLTLENGGYNFSYSNIYEWDSSFAKAANQPLPDDSIGVLWVAPDSQTEAIGGSMNLNIVFKRPNVQLGTGNVTLYNGDGSVREVISIRDPKKVKIGEVTDHDRNYYNLKKGEGSLFRISPTEDFKPGATYSVSVDAGAFTAAGGLKNNAIPKDQWHIRCADLKVTTTPKLGHEPVGKVGEPITYHFQFADDISRIYAEEPEHSGDYSCSVKELTSDGDMVFTPKKPGQMSWTINVVFKNGETTGMTENLTVKK